MLTDRQMTQVDLANAVGASPAYVNHTMTARKPPSAAWADLVADVLKVQTKQRAELHAAAARDHGFKLDLTPKNR